MARTNSKRRRLRKPPPSLRVTEYAEKIFGDANLARQYLNLPNPALKGRIPIEMAKTDAGAREVEAALSRFAHGDYI
jgi:putative toxin-antitoxin system antitoxin component (TIGR02293 family)